MSEARAPKRLRRVFYPLCFRLPVLGVHSTLCRRPPPSHACHTETENRLHLPMPNPKLQLYQPFPNGTLSFALHGCCSAPGQRLPSCVDSQFPEENWFRELR